MSSKLSDLCLFHLQINVGLVHINSEHTELKIKRASLLPISVRKAATDVTVKRLAVEKHMAHNKSLRAESAELNTEWILLYPDFDAVLYIPGTKECFSVEKYRESIGKPYNRVNLYLCRKTDYEGIILGLFFGFEVLLLSVLKFNCIIGLIESYSKLYKQSSLVINQLLESVPQCVRLCLGPSKLEPYRKHLSI